MKILLKTLGAAAIATALLSCENTAHNGHEYMADPSTIAITAITHDALYVVNGGDNSISVINTETDNIIGTIALQNIHYPHHISLSPDGGKLAIAVPGNDLSGGHEGHGSGTLVQGIVMMLDAKTGAMQSFKKLAVMNHNAAFSKDGQEIWTTQMSSGTVLVLKAGNFELLKTIPVGSGPAEVSFSPDGKYAFVANGESDNVTVIDAALKTVVKTIPVGNNPVGAWPASNNVMYVDNETGKSITAIDASTLEIIRTYQLGFTPAMAAVVGTELWVTDTQNGKVVIFKTDSDEKVGEITTAAGAHAIAFNADKSKAYISNQNANSVSVIDVATKTVLKTITVGSKPNGIVFRAH